MKAFRSFPVRDSLEGEEPRRFGRREEIAQARRVRRKRRIWRAEVAALVLGTVGLTLALLGAI